MQKGNIIFENSFNEELWYINHSRRNSILNIELAGITHADTSYYVSRCKDWDISVIEYVISGKGYIKCGNQLHTVSAGQTYILNNHTEHEYWSDKDDPFEKVWINVSGSFINKLFEVFNLSEPVIVRNINLSSYFNEIRQILSKGHDVEDLSTVILGMMFRISENTGSPSQKDIPLAEKIRNVVDKDINTQISAADISKLFYITPVYANRVFKAAYG